LRPRRAARPDPQAGIQPPGPPGSRSRGAATLSLRHAILGVLEFHPLHGYALKCVLEQGISQVWPVNLAAIYPCLRRLESEGLVSHERQTTPEGRPDRKVYSISEAGREEMARWRRLPPDVGEFQIKNPLLLKLLFAKRENLPQVRSWLDEALEDAAEQRERAVASLRNPERIPFFVRFLRETGLEHLDLNMARLSELRSRVDDLLRTGGGADDALRDQPLGMELS